ncbi:MaoC family dehydratase N-terminal domain-containing protein [Bradyrhizobium lablabi]|nr:MaoC family dehydratase N-terminal domain-containing protein [Bradyrhizobium lablabi]
MEGAGLHLASIGIIRRTGVDFARILHGEQRLVLHRQLQVAAELLANSRIAAVYDKGAGKGAVILRETTARSAADGAPLFTFVMAIVARGDGGFGGPQGSGPEPHQQMRSRPTFGVTATSSRSGAGSRARRRRSRPRPMSPCKGSIIRGSWRAASGPGFVFGSGGNRLARRP